MGNYKYLIISAFALAGRMGAIEHKSRGAAALYPGLCACCLFKAYTFLFPKMVFIQGAPTTISKHGI